METPRRKHTGRHAAQPEGRGGQGGGALSASGALIAMTLAAEEARTQMNSRIHRSPQCLDGKGSGGGCACVCVCVWGGAERIRYGPLRTPR